MRGIVWLTVDMVKVLHQELISEHGGHAGVRDIGLLESALAWAKNLKVYEPESTLVQLAGVCGYGVLRNHPFVDGNKRTAFMCVYTFLGVNGLHLKCSEEEAYQHIWNAASGDITEAQFIDWISRSVVEWVD